MKEIRIAVTGHRPERIKGKEQKIEEWIEKQIQIFIKNNDVITIIDGMAEGVDQIAAGVALNKGVQLSCYFPYKKRLYGVCAAFAEKATEVRFLYDKYWDKCYLERDRRMVDDCDLLLVVWDGKPWGGTYYTYKYALQKGKNVLIYPWENNMIEERWEAVEEAYNDSPSRDETDDDKEEWD